MHQTVLDFLGQQRVGALATALPDGTPHAAAMHYSYSAEPFELYFSTDKTSRKCLGLGSAKTLKAAVVIGFSEEDWETLQLDGEVRVIDGGAGLETIKAVHYAKHPNSKKFEGDPNTVFLAFTPSWWRYTDFKTKPPTILAMSVARIILRNGAQTTSQLF